MWVWAVFNKDNMWGGQSHFLEQIGMKMNKFLFCFADGDVYASDWADFLRLTVLLAGFGRDGDDFSLIVMVWGAVDDLAPHIWSSSSLKCVVS